VEDRRYGRQFLAERYDSLTPATEEGIRRYLGSGLIKGIGPTYAERIVARFGTRSLDIIENAPERLREIPGIGTVRLAKIRRAWREQRETRKVILFLQDYGISTAHAFRIYRAYGDQSLSILRDNPYRIASEIQGMGFRTADLIATKLGIDHDSPARIAEGVAYHLLEQSQQGHTCYPRQDLLKGAATMLGVSADLAGIGLSVLETQKRISVYDDFIYLSHLERAETEVSHRLTSMLTRAARPFGGDPQKDLERIQAHSGLVLGESQKDALRMALRERLSVITGNPGCGKSTLVRSITDFFRSRGLRVELAAPTGRAAKRLGELCNHPARTIHRMLEFRQGVFSRNEDNPLEADLIVVDETSMLDIILMQHLLRAVPSTARVIFVGDTDQLPSVGPGNVLRDMIESGRVAFVALTEIFRQAGNSTIVLNAHRINRGERPIFGSSDEDCFFLEEEDPDKLNSLVVSLVGQRLPSHYGIDPMRDVQVLCPMHRGTVGVGELNRRLQEALNPGSTSVTRGSMHFRTGDKVMQMVNNYEKEVFNGDIGIISSIDPEENVLSVRFDERSVDYEPDELDEISLAYACSVHKSQGSEFPVVIVVLHTQHYIMLQRNLIYTALTRARRVAVFTGSRKALAIGIRNNRVGVRHAHLGSRIRDLLTREQRLPSAGP